MKFKLLFCIVVGSTALFCSEPAKPKTVKDDPQVQKFQQLYDQMCNGAKDFAEKTKGMEISVKSIMQAKALSLSQQKKTQEFIAHYHMLKQAGRLTKKGDKTIKNWIEGYTPIINRAVEEISKIVEMVENQQQKTLLTLLKQAEDMKQIAKLSLSEMNSASHPMRALAYAIGGSQAIHHLSTDMMSTFSQLLDLL